MKNGNLEAYANGEMVYKLKDVYAKVVVIWNFEAPAGTGDTHYSIMRGSKANLIIRQGAEQGYKPELYIEPTCDNINYEDELTAAFAGLVKDYPGISLEKKPSGWQVIIPDSYRNGHEAHFAQVTRNYLQYLEDGKVPGAKTLDDVRRYYEAKVPLGRGCQPDDVMRAILYLIDQKYETGQALPVTGGQIMLG